MRIIAYHSNLYLDAFQLHVKEIKAKGFDTILFCITETDLLYNLETFQEFREYAESEGLKTWATFWGLTAGEAVCSGVIELKIWSQEVCDIGFKNILVDEPKAIDPTDLYLLSVFRNCDIHVCFSDDVFNKMSDEEIKDLPVKSVGLSCYHLGHRDWMKVTSRTVEWCSRLQRLRPNDNFVFIQAFDIAVGMEDLPMIVKDIAETEGINNFGVWSFRATAGTSSKRPKNYKQVWDNINFSEVVARLSQKNN